MSLQRLWIVSLLLWLLCIGSGCQSNWWARFTTSLHPLQTGEYGEKVFYFRAQPIAFPDFALTYRGERHVASDKYPRGFAYLDFQVVHDDESQIVSWSSGTGEIGPSFFTVAGQQYKLELAASDELGQLAEGELVIWRE
ncbi:MAG: hypothetical protein DYG89_49265 [Caldilinea sp. CFX5]|nr:hypothetical protein [Caldilinea sp. CFX5]